MVLIDTSVWVALFRDKTGVEKPLLESAVGGEEITLTRFNQLELLQGCKDENEWEQLSGYLNDQAYLEAAAAHGAPRAASITTSGGWAKRSVARLTVASRKLPLKTRRF